MIKRVCKNLMTALFTFLFLFCSINYIFAAEVPEVTKKILILNSYNQGTSWTRDQLTGILQTIDKSNIYSIIYTEYLDYKNFPAYENINYLHDYYKYKYQNTKLDLIITTDDAALNFALQYRGELFSNAPIVFSGVNQQNISQIKEKYRNFTGVLEKIDPSDTVKMALSLNPSIKNVYIAFDNSESGITTGRIIFEKIKEMNLKPIGLNMYTFDELLNTVSSLDKNSIVLFSTYYSDVNGNIFDFDLAAREISKHSTVPLYHQYDFGLNKGAIGGNMMSGSLSGKYSAELALRILKGEAADSIEIQSPNITRNVLDYQQLKRFKIPLSKIPENTEIINKPFSFIETYRYLVLGVFVAFGIMLLFVATLLIYIRKIKIIKTKLTYSNEELKNHLEEISQIQDNLFKSEEKYTYLAFHDVLTGLLNRRSLFNDVEDIFSNKKYSKITLLFIDIDNFKYINDTMGHEYGDELIKQASERLLSALKNNSTLYRLGGDEFIILERGAGKNESENLISRIFREFKKEFIIKSGSVHISISVGMAMYPDHGENIEDLIKASDIAMYKAKEKGKNRYQVYEKNMNKPFKERMIMEKLLHVAMEKDEFELYYQPQLDINNNRITGLEALLRWKSDELGFVSPVKFIKIVEDNHLIIPIGEWVIIKACDFLNHLHKKGYSEMTMSINVSILQILQADFTDKLLKILDIFNIKPSDVELEITETVLIETFDKVIVKLKMLREKGISIALDDFGKGYSSLNYLKQLPISTLKIDKCFIDNLVSGVNESNNQTITRYIISLGRSLGMSVVAEGVEHQEQLECLKKYNCNKIQGYLFSKPLPRDEAEKLVELNLK